MAIISRKRNILILQSGGPTPVINRSLFGLVDEAMKHADFDKILGSQHGIEGMLKKNFFDLGNQDSSTWNKVSATPGSALGSTRKKLSSEEIPDILEILSSENIRYCFIIGGNDSAETGLRISSETKISGYELSVICIPKTIDNDLVLMDHTPGYGSASRFVALATAGIGRDVESMGKHAPIAILEVMGRDSGWLAAASALSRRVEQDPPHIICTPEKPIEEDDFLSTVENSYNSYGFAVAVVAENIRSKHGVMGDQQKPWYVDDFGHEYFDGPGRYLSGLVSQKLKVRARYEKPGTIQRSMINTVSISDAQEAEMAGRSAISYALEGLSEVMVTLERNPGEKYECTTSFAPLAKVAGKVKYLPDSYTNERHQVTDEFLEYAKPLIGDPIPEFGRLKR